MRHPIAVRWIHRYLDGELSPWKTRYLERHLRNCEACREEWRTLRLTHQMLTGDEFPGFIDTVQENPVPLWRRVWWVPVGVMAVAVALAVVWHRQPFVEGPSTVRAVRSGLEFLAATQHTDGSWDTSYYPHSVAATAMGLASFVEYERMGVASQPVDEAVVHRAVEFLKHQTRPGGLVVGDREHSVAMYAHGLGIMALARWLQTHDDEQVRLVVGNGVRLICTTQSPRGGWRYQPVPHDQDLPVTVVQLLALAEAHRAGIKVPQPVVTKALAYVRTCVTPQGSVRYQPHRDEPDTLARLQAVEAVWAAYRRPGEGRAQRAVAGRLNAWSVDLKGLTEDPYGFFALGFLPFQEWTEKFPDSKHVMKVRSALLAGQRPDGSWENRIGPAYATAVATWCLQKFHATRSVM